MAIFGPVWNSGAHGLSRWQKARSRGFPALLLPTVHWEYIWEERGAQLKCSHSCSIKLMSFKWSPSPLLLYEIHPVIHGEHTPLFTLWAGRKPLKIFWHGQELGVTYWDWLYSEYIWIRDSCTLVRIRCCSGQLWIPCSNMFFFFKSFPTYLQVTFFILKNEL